MLPTARLAAPVIGPAVAAWPRDGLVNQRWRAGLARVAKVAILDRPCDVTVVTRAAVLTVDYFEHVDFVAAGLELESQISVTDFAGESCPVKPMRKHDRPHAGLVGEIVNHDIAIFRMGRIA